MRHDTKAEFLAFADGIIYFLVKFRPDVLALCTFEHRPTETVIFIQSSGIATLHRNIYQILVIPLLSTSTGSVQIGIGERNNVKTKIGSLGRKSQNK